MPAGWSEPAMLGILPPKLSRFERDQRLPVKRFMRFVMVLHRVYRVFVRLRKGCARLLEEFLSVYPPSG